MITDERIAEIKANLEQSLPIDPFGPNRFDQNTGLTVEELHGLIAKAQAVVAPLAPAAPDPAIVAEMAQTKSDLLSAQSMITKLQADLDAASKPAPAQG